jgi:hypothetical protein
MQEINGELFLYLSLNSGSKVEKKSEIALHIFILFTAVAPHGDKVCKCQRVWLRIKTHAYLPGDKTAEDVDRFMHCT